jgi:hypothetical protein
MAASSVAMSGGLLRSAAPRLNSAALTHFVVTNKTRASDILGGLGDKSIRIFFRERLAAPAKASLTPQPVAYRPYIWRSVSAVRGRSRAHSLIAVASQDIQVSASQGARRSVPLCPSVPAPHLSQHGDLRAQLGDHRRPAGIVLLQQREEGAGADRDGRAALRMRLVAPWAATRRAAARTVGLLCFQLRAPLTGGCRWAACSCS